MDIGSQLEVESGPCNVLCMGGEESEDEGKTRAGDGHRTRSSVRWGVIEIGMVGGLQDRGAEPEHRLALFG